MTQKCSECGQIPADGRCPVNNPMCPTVAYVAPSQAPEQALIGTLVAGRYRVDEVIGKGGFGTVFAAQHVTTKQSVVIKVLNAQMSADKLQVQRFYNEAQMTAQLRHPNTVKVFDFGVTDSGLLFIAMERLNGRELADVFKAEGKLDPARAVRIACAILRSLAEAHSVGLVHRDLKPGNIFLCDVPGEPDYVKLLDFGIAKDTDGGTDSDLTKTGFAVGTPKYMSPEQGRAEKLDQRSDLYSLGVILYELLCGQAPFTAPSAMSLIVKHMQEPAPPLRPRVEGLPDGLAEIVMTALQKSPSARFYDADDMRASLELVLERAGEPVSPTKRALTAQMRGLTPGVVAAAAAQAGAPLMSGGEDETVALRTKGAADTVHQQAAGPQPTQLLDTNETNVAAQLQEPDVVPAPTDKHDDKTIMGEHAAAALAAAANDRAVHARPGRTVKSDKKRGSMAGPVLIAGVLAAAGWVGWQVQQGKAVGEAVNPAAAVNAAVSASKKALSAGEKASKAAIAAVETRGRDRTQAKKGHRDMKGPKFKEELAAEAQPKKEVTAQAKAKGFRPPLDAKTIDDGGKRIKNKLRSCWKKHGVGTANFKRVRIDIEVARDGKVTEASYSETGNDKLSQCFEAAASSLRFADDAENAEAHQLFVNLGGKLRGRRAKSTAKPASTPAKAATFRANGDAAL